MQSSHGFWFLLARGLQLRTSLSVLAVVVPQLIGCCQQKAVAPAAPPEVEIVEVQQPNVQIYSEWVPTLDGYINAQVQPQVTGYLWRSEERASGISRQVLGTTVIGGVPTASTTAIYLIPVSYYVVERIVHRVSKRSPGGSEPEVLLTGGD